MRAARPRHQSHDPVDDVGPQRGARPPLTRTSGSSVPWIISPTCGHSRLLIRAVAGALPMTTSLRRLPLTRARATRAGSVRSDCYLRVRGDVRRGDPDHTEVTSSAGAGSLRDS